METKYLDPMACSCNSSINKKYFSVNICNFAAALLKSMLSIFFIDTPSLFSMDF